MQLPLLVESKEGGWRLGQVAEAANDWQGLSLTVK